MEPETISAEKNNLQYPGNDNQHFPISFPVVGIGASAGGLDAFKKVVSAIPENSGMAWVLVQHLDPNHESMLTELIQKVAKVPVSEITDEVKIFPNRIYIIPSNKMLQVKEDRLKLSPRPLNGKEKESLPIDVFFTSLAQVYEAHAIGVILSGTASDGTRGLKLIKDHGGITIAQTLESAAFNGMPYNAIQSGMVDFILKPENIPSKLLEIVKALADDTESTLGADDEIFNKILSILRLRKEMDFTYYKQSTIRRRILRRMVLNKLEHATAYLKYLEKNPAEQDLLYHDILIPVTSFFRDKKIFDNLCESVFPSIIKNKSSDGHIRIWIAGCSTGQEAYSIAICFKEYLGHKKEKIHIFATDLSESAILKARTGVYSKAEIESVSPGRLKEYFTYTNGTYRVNKELRDICVFAVHNFLKDPPFSKIDFVSCRNVLIYMDSYLQKKALANFHYALNPKGLLLLGKSENTIGVTDLFTAQGKHDKIFVRKDVPSKIMHSGKNIADPLPYPKVSKRAQVIATDFEKTADDLILNQYSPAGVVVNDAMDIVHFRGNTADYLQQHSGKPTHSLLKMARPGLAFELRSLIHKVKQDRYTVKKDKIVFAIDNQEMLISISAIPLPNTVEPFYLVLFQPQVQVVKKSFRKGYKASEDEKLLRIEQLENEITQLREDMRVISDEQEATNEELQSGNEELMSSNEELQSLNEELETSKEELQSTIEELTAVNQEMVNLNDQLTLEEQRKEDFLKMVSHELKTPVTSIKGYVQLLLTMLEENQAITALPLKTSLGRIDSQLVRLTRLITEMLDLSRIEAGRMELQRKLFNLNELVVETVHDVSQTNQTHEIIIRNDLQCNIEGDEDRIGQVLINLLNNAIKYSPAGNQVVVRIYETRDNYVAVSVADKGIGIDKRDHAKIFERFYRVSGESELSYSGFGIGLFIANQIIQRHDGYLAVESKKEEGSVFTFSLPLNRRIKD